MKIILKSSLIALLFASSQVSFGGTFVDSASVVSVDKVYKQVRVDEPFQDCYIKETVQSGDGSATNEIIGGIIGGAIGNIIDSCFYGLIFNESYNNVATFLPEAGGYAPLLHGKVVDMFYFPLFDTIIPEWVPFKGGDRFRFFGAIFNIADASISVGVINLLLFHRKFFN